MDPDAEFPLPPPASQASSHCPLPEPASGATLYELEAARREDVARRGRVKTGCAEIDDEVLLGGGFERGCVVGVSAEEAELGVLAGLQTVAHNVVFGTKQRAAIITTLAVSAILPKLRDVIRAQVQAKLGPAANHQQQVVNAEVRRCLEQISVSRVFDIEGLWEVMSELETPPSPAPVAPNEEKADDAGVTVANKESMLPVPLELSRSSSRRSAEEGSETAANPLPQPPPKFERTEVGDSEEDEDEALYSSPLSMLSSPPPPSMSPPPQASSSPLPPLRPPRPTPSPSPAPAPPAPVRVSELKPIEKDEKEESVTSHIPNLILITHFSALLTNLFTRAAENKASAHTTLQLLSSHLRYLVRTEAGPLVMLLNTTTTTATSTATTTAPSANTNPNATPATAAKNRPLEPTLRSIFNSAPPGGGGTGGGNRRNKPAFGATFAQFLDLHLLCTRVPRAKADAEALFAPASAATGFHEVRYCWVVEVLLDELGVWEWQQDRNKDGDKGIGKGKEKGGNKTLHQDRRWTRKSREQRWGAVDVRGGIRLVDAFQGGWQQQQQQQPQVKGPVRLAAGFGGPPPRGL
ncbi:hypothetical protein F4819DRAFT_32715 [Hypoxylon fuscum]|nr:hypothetical protein F4819DRAFT_32715 [Hypoxylon fuscum]